jgi:hypothetical protein
MKITGIKSRLMHIPFTEFLRAAYGGRSHASDLLVTIETDEGINPESPEVVPPIFFAPWCLCGETQFGS